MDQGPEYKGRRAKEILEDEVFVEVIDTAKAGILTKWNLTYSNETEIRESLYYQGRALDEILRGLRTLVEDWVIDKSRKQTKKGRG